MMSLRKVLERLYTCGWTQGCRQNDLNQRCIVGAFFEDNYTNSDILRDVYPKECAILADIIREKYPLYQHDSPSAPYLTIVDFNDHEHTTFEDVVGVIEEAIRRQDLTTKQKILVEV